MASLTKAERSAAARKAAETRRKNRLKASKAKPRAAKKKPKTTRKPSSSRSNAARKAWATRRKNEQIVGYYKKDDKTRPITKPKAEVRRKKIVTKPRDFKGVSPKSVAHAQKVSKAEKLKSIMGLKKKSKKPKKWAQKAQIKKGALKELGYDPKKSDRSRHLALNKSIENVGFDTTQKRIQFLANVTPDNKKLDEIYKKDLKWLRKMKLPSMPSPSKAEKRKAKKESKPKKTVKLKQGGASVYRLPAKRTWRRESKSSPGTWYTQRLNQDGSLSCNCKGWIFSKYPKQCRHTREIAEKHKVGLA